MVDVTEKNETVRVARGEGLVEMSAEKVKVLSDRDMRKGDPEEVAGMKGIQGGRKN